MTKGVFFNIFTVQYWLDCSTMPAVISAVQAGDEENMLFVLLKLTRNYCHGLHKARLFLLQCEYNCSLA